MGAYNRQMIDIIHSIQLNPIALTIVPLIMGPGTKQRPNVSEYQHTTYV